LNNYCTNLIERACDIKNDQNNKVSIPSNEKQRQKEKKNYLPTLKFWIKNKRMANILFQK